MIIVDRSQQVVHIKTAELDQRNRRQNVTRLDPRVAPQRTRLFVTHRRAENDNVVLQMRIHLVHARPDTRNHRPVQNRKMMKVEYVLDDPQIRRRRVPRIFRGSETWLARALNPRYLARRFALAIPVPDDPMLFAHADERQVESNRPRRADPVGGNQHASPRSVKAKPMIRTFKKSVANLPRTQS